jgi:hypothetical protein
MSEISIELEDNGTKGRYLARIDGSPEPAVLTYSRVNPSLIIVDHTEIPDSLRGRGVGAALARHVVDEARVRQFRIIPLCPFFNAQLARYPEWMDVIRK